MGFQGKHFTSETSNPLTTKGDLAGFSTVSTRVPIGSDGQVLVSDSTQTNGLKWSSSSGAGLWQAATPYLLNQSVLYSKNLFICVTAHTSTSSFETDLLSGYWQLVNENPANKNYFRFQNFEDNDVSGWTLGTVTIDGTTKFPNAAPTFGSGASANLSLAIVTGGSQLAGTYSLSMISSAATTAGNFMASPVLKIDKEDMAKMLKFRFSYLPASGTANAVWSGLYSTNSFGIAIYDIDNAAWIQPSGCFSMTSGSATLCGTGYGEFQTSASGTQYRLVVYNANATIGAITNYFDSFEYGPQKQSYGSPVTDWQSYTATIGADTTPPTPGTSTKISMWRRVGDSMEIYFDYNQSGAGSSGSGAYRFPLPSGYSIDISKIPVNPGNSSSVGSGAGFDGTTTFVGLNAFIGGTTYLKIFTSTGAVGSTIIPIGNANARFGFTAMVPIVGWSSSVIFSSDANTNVVALTSYRTTSMSAMAAATQTLASFPTVSKDTTGSFNATFDTYTVPSNGIYEITPNLLIICGASTTRANLSIYIDGAQYCVNDTEDITSAQQRNLGRTCKIPLNAGQTIKIYTLVDAGTASYVYSDGNKQSSLSISKISGPVQIAASESVSARYYTLVAQSVPNSGYNLIDFEVKDWDSHNLITGAGSGINGTFRITAPISGEYRINSGIVLADNIYAIGNATALHIYKGGTSNAMIARVQAETVNSRYAAVSGSGSVKLKAGEYVDIRVFNSRTAGVTALYVITKEFNWIEVTRVGNY
jgi:hypothetical protein